MTATVLNRFEQTTGKDNHLILDGTVIRNGAPLQGFVGGTHIVTPAEAGAGAVSIPTPLSVILSQIVQIIRANEVATSDAIVGSSANELAVAAGTSFALQAGDIINYIAFGA